MRVHDERVTPPQCVGEGPGEGLNRAARLDLPIHTLVIAISAVHNSPSPLVGEGAGG